MESSRKFFGNVPKNVPENWQCAKMFRVFFFVGLMGTSLSSISQRVSLTKFAARFVNKVRSASRCELCSRPVAAIHQDVTVCFLSD